MTIPAVKTSKKYFEATGKRKTSVARVRLHLHTDKDFSFLVNEKTIENYFPGKDLRNICLSPLDLTDLKNKFKVSVIVKGGGIHSQAEAIRHGISRALIIFDPSLRKKLKDLGFLKRDPRMKERKKFGLKRARRAPQWQKR